MRAATPALRAAAARPSQHSARRCVCRRMAAAAASAAAAEEGKTIYLIRHGMTEMNVYLSINSWSRCERLGKAKTAACFALTRRRSKMFKDPLLYDTKLTAEGEKQACAPPRPASLPGALSPCFPAPKASSLANRVATLAPAPQLLVASPLRRALRTAELAFAAAPAPPALPRLVTPLCRERLYHSSDVGRAPAVLAAEHPTWCVARISSRAAGRRVPHWSDALES